MDDYPDERRRRVWPFILLGLMVVALVGGGFGFFWLQKDFPSLEAVRHPSLPQASWVVAADGTVLGEFYQERRRWLDHPRLTPDLRNAFIVAHDPTFATRPALSWLDLLATVSHAGPHADRHPGGLSVPLADQLLRQSGFLGRARAWLLAKRLESELSKDELVDLYLNSVDLGEGGHGVEEASLHWFSKSAATLSLEEAALLSSIAPRPGAQSPRPSEAALKRRNEILDAMAAAKVAPVATVEGAKAAPIALKPFHTHPSAVLQRVRAELRKALGRQKVASGGYTIHLTVDPALQARAELAVRNAALEADESVGWRGAVTSMDAALYTQVREKVLGKREGLLDLHGALSALAAGKAETIARLSRALPTEVDSVVLGRVEKVSRAAAEVQAGSVKVRVPVESAGWAFAKTDSDHDLTRLAHEGDLIWVRLTSLKAGSDGLLPGKLEQRTSADGAMVIAESNSGRVLALVGGTDPATNVFDKARQLARGVGAGLSPILYGLAVEQRGLNAATLMHRPKDVTAAVWTGDVPPAPDAAVREPITAFEGFVTHDAGAHAAVEEIVVDSWGSTLAKIGFRPPSAASRFRGPVGSPWALATSWTITANDGMLRPLRLVDRVDDAAGKSVWQPDEAPTPIFSAKTAQLMRAWLASAGRYENGQALASHVSREGWFAGRAGAWVIATWIGPEGSGVPGEFLSGNAAPRQAFEAVAAGQPAPDKNWGPVVEAWLDPESGLLAWSRPEIAAPFLPGTAPTQKAPRRSVRTPMKTKLHARPRKH